MTHDTTTPTRWQRWRAQAWFFWGASLCYWGVQTHERALFRAGVGSFGRAIAAWPGMAAAYYRRGLIRGRELGEIAEAQADMTQAIALDGNWPEPYLQRGLFERFHGTPQAALSDLREFLRLGGSPTWRAEAERQITAIESESA